MFFFKQKTAYEMRISDWSSDVCSSDLWGYVVAAVDHPERGLEAILEQFLSPDQADASNDEYLDSDQLIAALDLLDAAAADAGSPLDGAIDTERVAAEGHRAGGSASGTAASDERVHLWIGQRSEARRVGKEWVSTCRSRWSQTH